MLLATKQKSCFKKEKEAQISSSLLKNWLHYRAFVYSLHTRGF